MSAREKQFAATLFPGHRQIRTSRASPPVAALYEATYECVLDLAEQVNWRPGSRPADIQFLAGPNLSTCDFVLVSLREALPVSKPKRASRIIKACQRLAGWANFSKEPGTALGYVQAAIELRKATTYRAARDAAQKGHREGAELLFKSAIKYAEATGDWEQTANAWTQLGRNRVMAQRPELAIEAHGRALHIARAHRLRLQEAQALHNLATVALDLRDGPTAFVYARLALQAYGQDYGSLSLLANDVAYHWMTSEAAFEPALEIFDATLRHASKAIDQMDIWANVARAAAGCGLEDRYDHASGQVEVRIPGIQYRERVSGALLEVAEGAHLLHRYDHARELARRALRLAEQRDERKYKAHANELLQRIEHRTHRPFASQVSGVDRVRNHALADQFVSLLNARSTAKS